MTLKSGVMFLKNSPLCRGHVSEKGVGNVSEKHALKWGHDPDKSQPTKRSIQKGFNTTIVLAIYPIFFSPLRVKRPRWSNRIPVRRDERLIQNSLPTRLILCSGV